MRLRSELGVRRHTLEQAGKWRTCTKCNKRARTAKGIQALEVGACLGTGARMLKKSKQVLDKDVVAVALERRRQQQQLEEAATSQSSQQYQVPIWTHAGTELGKLDGTCAASDAALTRSTSAGAWLTSANASQRPGV